MQIGVIGAGQLGATLAEWCAESGHDVAVTSRHPERLGAVVDRLTETGGPLQLTEVDVFHATDVLAEALSAPSV
jgi:predicted dinucleotide-binding enzyme